MAQHVQFSVDTGVDVYFCDPKSPWQRGTNENTNGLLRQYFPKGTDMSKITQEELDQAAYSLNADIRISAAICGRGVLVVAPDRGVRRSVVVQWRRCRRPRPRIVQDYSCRAVSSWADPTRREGERGNGPHQRKEHYS